ncbi:MAG: DUF2934 domain-containing protein [Gammaproteobacteria bacterium]|nr:DUF2934 domain-containing protein [Gammaproteobacteria bacterium]
MQRRYIFSPHRLAAKKEGIVAKKRLQVLNGIVAASKPSQVITAEKRRALIAEIAYFRAEARGFAGGDATDDWLQAERQVDEKLMTPSAKNPPARADNPLARHADIGRSPTAQELPPAE